MIEVMMIDRSGLIPQRKTATCHRTNGIKSRAIIITANMAHRAKTTRINKPIIIARSPRNIRPRHAIRDVAKIIKATPTIMTNKTTKASRTGQLITLKQV
jgi:hypothetical protein